ncbi:hypothetical protein LSAT2_027098 [Lamellibrachia satsuma]|nr:hypothetical protein LSAT2_027098 [Lamellibrachia satsuma]
MESLERPKGVVSLRHFRLALSGWRPTKKSARSKEFLATNDPSYWHSTKILSTPFEDKKSRVANSGLQLVDLETQTMKYVHDELWLKSSKQGRAAARAHAVSIVKCIRTWSNRIFTTGLSKERNLNERKKILDELYSRLVDLVAQSPGDGCYDYFYIFVTVAKTGEL